MLFLLNPRSYSPYDLRFFIFTIEILLIFGDATFVILDSGMQFIIFLVINYYCCYLLSLDASTLTQGPLGVLSWNKWKLRYICYHIVFSFRNDSLTCSLSYYYCCYLLSLDASTLTHGPLGVLSWKKSKLCYVCYHVVFSFTYASLTCLLIYYYYCYWMFLDASTLTQGPLGVLSWKKWKLCYICCIAITQSVS